jgi:DNA-binding transcriptional ArsR family regulator
VLREPALDDVLHALADPTRRAIVERLAAGSASVSDLARPFDMTLSAIVQAVQWLEQAGVVQTSKVGRTRTVSLAPEGLAAAERWFETHRRRWEQRFDRLGDLLAEEHDDDEKTDKRSKR